MHARHTPRLFWSSKPGGLHGVGRAHWAWFRRLTLAFLGCLGSVSSAPAVGAPSDAMILVQPMGSQVIVAFVFPKVVSHKLLEARIRNLARNAGWSVASVEINDEAVRPAGKSAAYGRPTLETGATVVFRNAAQARDGGFLLQPYLDAWADLRRIEILYMTPAFADFRGLRDFDSPALSVHLLRAGGPYHYLAEIRDHTHPLPILPLTQVVEAPRPRQKMPFSPTLAGEIGLACAVASAAGLITMAGFMVRLRFRGRMKPVGKRQASRSHLR
ncbi:MAG: hypothetical protein ACP5VE_02640 [Chthonomonadales bacterium]